MMRCWLFAWSVLALAVSAGAEQRLNLFIWSEYIDPDVVAEFEARHHCKVVIDLYEDDAAMLAKLRAGGAALYDVVVPPDHRVPALIKLGLLAPLRRENLPNFRNLEPRFTGLACDPNNEYTVAYQWGTLGMLVRRRDGKPVPDSWGAVFDPRQQAGPFVLIDSPRDLIGAALKYRGHSLNSTESAHLKAARDDILAAKVRCHSFDGSVAGKNKVLSKAADVAIVYSGEAARAMREDPATTYVVPREGSLIWVDHLAVLAKAPHRDLAEKFVNYCLDGRVSARISSFTGFSSPNRAAREFLRPEDLTNLVIYPPAEVLARLEFAAGLGPESRLYDEVWTQVKAR